MVNLNLCLVKVDEIAIDTTTGRPFKTGAGVLKDLEFKPKTGQT